MPIDITDLFTNISIFAIIATCGGILLSIALTVGIIFFVRRFINKNVMPDRGVLQNGVPAQAKITSVQQTGMMVNNQPQIVFELEVHPSTGSMPYRAQTKAVIPLVNIPQLQPGVEVPVKVHPTNPAQVVLDIYQS